MKQTKASRGYSWAAFCLTAALVFGILGGIQLWDIHSLRLRGEVVPAQVVDSDFLHCATRSCSHKHRDWIDVEYVTLSGQRIRQRTGKFRASAAVGGWIEVRYDREHPRHVQDASSGLGYPAPIALSGSFTVLFVVFAALLLRKRRRDD